MIAPVALEGYSLDELYTLASLAMFRLERSATSVDWQRSLRWAVNQLGLGPWTFQGGYEAHLPSADSDLIDFLELVLKRLDWIAPGLEGLAALDRSRAYLNARGVDQYGEPIRAGEPYTLHDDKTPVTCSRRSSDPVEQLRRPGRTPESLATQRPAWAFKWARRMLGLASTSNR